MKPFTLVVNLSLRSIRIIIFDDNGKKQYEDWLPVRTHINGSSVEQDPNEWWELLLNLFSTLSQKKDIIKNIGYITVTSSSLCLVFLDKSGKVINHSMMVSDKRAARESELLSEKFSKFFEKHQGMRATPSFMLPKILWLKRNHPSTFKQVKYYLSSNDFLVYKLTGKMVTDYLNAEKSYFDISKGSYHLPVLQYVGIKKTQLPKVVSPGTLAGPIHSSVQKSLGTKSKIQLVVTTYDAICALIGGSTYKKGELNNVCGTCSSYRMFLPESASPEAPTLFIQQMPDEKKLIVGGSNNLEGGVIEWAKECFYGDSYLKDDSFLYSLMQKEAQKSELGARGILFLPYLLGERVPFTDPNVRGMFFGIERFSTRKDIIRSIYESIGFQARLMIDEFETNGIEISSVVMSGGVSQMPFAAKVRADILGMPIHVLDEVETTALGAYILILKARKKIKSIREGRKYIKIKKTYIPNMHNHNAYSSLFLLYKQLYTTNKSLFESKRSITRKIIKYQKTVLANL